MAPFKSCIFLGLALLFILFHVGEAEIHRAVKNKHTIRHTHDEQTSHEHRKQKYSSLTWIYALMSASLIGLSGIFPLLVIPLEAGKSLRKGEPAAQLKLLLSYAVGGLLGDVFLHLLPEAWAHLDQGHDHRGHLTIGLWVIAGLLSFMIVEKVFPDAHEGEADDDGHDITNTQVEENAQCTIASKLNSNSSPQRKSPRQRKNKKKHSSKISNGVVSNGTALHNGINGTSTEHKQPPDKEGHIKTIGWLNLLANVIDNFTHGLAVAGSYCISHKVGFVTTIAILLHEVPHEIGDFAILLRSGFDRWKAAKAQLLTASGGLLGALTALTAESAEAAGNSTAWILPFTSGGFIYIALVTVVPDLLKEKCPRESLKQLLLLIGGIATMAGVTLFFD